MDRLAERRQRAKRQEAMAKVAAKASLEMARDLQAVKSQAFSEGFHAGITEAHRLARSAGTIDSLRRQLAKLLHKPSKEQA